MAVFSAFLSLAASLPKATAKARVSYIVRLAGTKPDQRAALYHHRKRQLIGKSRWCCSARSLNALTNNVICSVSFVFYFHSARFMSKINDAVDDDDDDDDDDEFDDNHRSNDWASPYDSTTSNS